MCGAPNVVSARSLIQMISPTPNPSEVPLSRSLQVIPLGVILAALSVMPGCTSSSPLSGEQILRDIRASGIPVTGEAAGINDLSVHQAASPLPQSGVTLADLIDAARYSHPRIIAAGARVGAAEGQRWQASLYPDRKSVV